MALWNGRWNKETARSVKTAFKIQQYRKVKFAKNLKTKKLENKWELIF